jgi:hypothetical protein
MRHGPPECRRRVRRSRDAEASGEGPDVVSHTIEGESMYGHSHTGIGALMLTLVAAAKGGIGYLVRHVSSPHW